MVLLRRNSFFRENREKLGSDPSFLVREVLDKQGVESVALMNYVVPDVAGLTYDANRFTNEYCKDYLDRLLTFGSAILGCLAT